MHAELALGRLPILLGGDHCLGIGSISAVARHCREQGKKLRVLWLDAHADFNTHTLTPSGNIHGMPVACLCGLGPQALIEIGGQVPAINPKWVRQVGIRSVDAGEKRLVHEAGLEPWSATGTAPKGATMDQLAALGRDVAGEIRETAQGGLPVFEDKR
jgi:arginase